MLCDYKVGPDSLTPSQLPTPSGRTARRLLKLRELRTSHQGQEVAHWPGSGVSFLSSASLSITLFALCPELQLLSSAPPAGLGPERTHLASWFCALQLRM